MRRVQLFIYYLLASSVLLFGIVPIKFVPAQVVSAQDDGALDVRVLAEPTVEEETISFEVVVANPNGSIVGDLTAENFSFDEDIEDLVIERLEERPIAVIFIVNTGLGTELPLLQQTLTAYFADYYREGDEVALYILDGQATSQTPRIVLGNTVSDFALAINQLSRPANYLNISETLADALGQAQRWQDADPERPVQVVYIAPFLNRLSERDSSLQFANADIPFHVVQVHEARLDASANMQALATNGGGLFANNQGGILVNDNGDAVSELLTLYEGIVQNRVSYRITYHPSTPSGEVRTATLTVTAPNGTQGSANYTYEGLTLPPVIQIIEPVVLDDTIIIINESVPSEQLIANITFPDGVQRNLASLRLQITDNSTGNVILSLLETNIILPESNNHTVRWNYGNYAIPNTTTRIRLTITITDALGYTVSAQSNGTIRFLQATPIPTATSNIPTLTPTAVPLLNEDMTAVAQGSVILLPLLVLISILGLGVLIQSFRVRNLNRQQRSRPIYYAPQPTVEIDLSENKKPVEPVVDNSANTQAPKPTQEKDQIYARLFVMQGLDAHEILITHTPFKIGRSSDKGNDYIINQPIINPEHCVFVVKDKGGITLTDLNSKNGTFVNGERLQANREAIVPIGSEVQITRNISVQLNDPESVYSPTIRRGSTQGYESQQAQSAFGFRPMLQVRYIDGDGDIPEDYLPL